MRKVLFANAASAMAALLLALLCLGAAAADFDAYKRVIIAGDPAPVLAMLRVDAGRAPLGRQGESLLHLAGSYAIGEQRSKMTAALLAAGASVDARNLDGATPLYWATGSDCADCVALLLKAGAQATARNAKGATALHVSGPQIAAMLIAAGADPKAADNEGNRPLHRMYHEAFLVVGVNARNVHGFTPLHFAEIGRASCRERVCLAV